MSYENTRAEAAKWMWDREVKDHEGTHYWHHTVFTAQNPSEDSLRHDWKLALTIFGDLVERGLLVTFAQHNGELVYRINHGRDPEWKAVMHHHADYFWGIGAKIDDWIGSGIVGAVIGAGVTAVIAWTFCG